VYGVIFGTAADTHKKQKTKQCGVCVFVLVLVLGCVSVFCVLSLTTASNAKSRLGEVVGN